MARLPIWDLGVAGRLLEAPFAAAGGLFSGARAAYRALRHADRDALRALRELVWSEADRWYLPPVSRWAGGAVGIAAGTMAAAAGAVSAPIRRASAPWLRSLRHQFVEHGRRGAVATINWAAEDMARSAAYLGEAASGAVEFTRRYLTRPDLDEAGRPVVEAIRRGERAGFIGLNWRIHPAIEQAGIPVALTGGLGYSAWQAARHPVFLPDRPVYEPLPGVLASPAIDDMGATGDLVFALNNLRRG